MESFIVHVFIIINNKFSFHQIEVSVLVLCMCVCME